MTPTYYRTGPDTDLYDLWRAHYGIETASRHLEMSALEYLYRAPQKGSYLADLAKVQTIIQRLLAWGESPEGRAMRRFEDALNTATNDPLTPEAEAEARAFLCEQAVWQLEQEGYEILPPHSDTTPPKPL